MVSNSWDAVKSGAYWLGLNSVRGIESGIESVRDGIADGLHFSGGFGYDGTNLGADGIQEGIQAWTEDLSEKVRRSVNITGGFPSVSSGFSNLQENAKSAVNGVR